MKKQIEFWWPHMSAKDKARYAGLSLKIEDLHAECKKLRDRAYQCARRVARQLAIRNAADAKDQFAKDKARYFPEPDDAPVQVAVEGLLESRRPEAKET